MRCVLALDVALANLGWAVVALDGSAVLASGVTTTAKTARKRPASQDLARRCKLLVRSLDEIHEGRHLVLVVAELPDGSRDARSMRALGAAVGAVAAWADLACVPAAFFTPAEVKKAAGGGAKAEKKVVQKAVLARWPGYTPAAGRAHGKGWEHVADALGAYLAAERAGGLLKALRFAEREPSCGSSKG